MKKTLFALLLVSILFLTGCDDITGEVPENPMLEVVGDLDITIGLNDEYVDQGVNVIGDYDLDITTDNQVDSSAYGIYSVRYSVEYNGDIISIVRKVRVVPSVEENFNIQLGLLSEDPFAITFSIDISDAAGDLLNGQVVLYNKGEVVETRSVTNGSNTIEFVGLENQSYYLLELEGSYFENGVEYTLEEYFIGGNTTLIDPSLYPRLELIGSDVVYLDKGDVFVDDGVTIIGDYNLDITVTSPVNTEVPGTYLVRYTIVYNQASIYAHRTVIVAEGEADLFVIDVQFVESVEDSLVFSVSVDDPDELITGRLGVLYLGESEVSSFVYSEGITMMNFDNLLSDTTYRFELKGMYDVDGTPTSIGDFTVTAKSLEVNEISVFVLNGEDEMEVAQYSEFVDPGAIFTGEPNAVIEATSNVDISTPGVYYITYTATLGEAYYNLIRTVTVVAGDAIDFAIELEYVSNTESSLTYTLTVGDNYDLMETHFVKLYEFATLVEEFEFVAGVNTFTFTNLKPGTEYWFYTYGTYLRGGYTESIGDYYRSDSTLEATAPEVTLTSYEIGLVDIDVLVNVADEHSQITQITVSAYTNDEYEPYQENFADLVNGDNQVLLDNLMYEHDYKLVLEYTYRIFGTSEYIDVEEELLVFSTLAPPKPDLVSIDCDRESNSFTCDAVWDIDGFEPDSMWYFIQLRPWGDAYKIVLFENSGATLSFDELETGVDYLITVFADYVVSDTSERYISEIDEFYLEIKLRPFD